MPGTVLDVFKEKTSVKSAKVLCLGLVDMQKKFLKTCHKFSIKDLSRTLQQLC